MSLMAGEEVPIWRLLDANVNRAREGLRVIEDTARFVLDKPAMAKAVRRLRHRLDEMVRHHYKTLLQHRNVKDDSGRRNPSPNYKGGVHDLLAANFKRCEEALRALEEYGRVISPATVTQGRALRFEVYGWEKKLCLQR